MEAETDNSSNPQIALETARYRATLLDGQLTEALAEIERLRAEVARLEAVVALQRGSMQPHRDEYELAQFQWNLPPNAPGNEPR